MKIVSVVLQGNFTDGMAYQENCLPYYQKIVYNAEVVIVAGQYMLKEGTNQSVMVPIGEYKCTNGLRLIRIKSMRNKFLKKFAYYPSLYEVLEREAPDYIFVHLVQSISLFALKKYKKNHPNVKIFGDSHADYINSANNWISKNILHKLVWKFVLRKNINCFEAVYGVLPTRVDFLKKMYQLPEDKVKLLLMGAEDQKIKSDLAQYSRGSIRQELAIEEKDFVIITGGKIDKKKNLKILVDAIKNLKLDELKLIIFGKADNEMKAYLEHVSNETFVRYVGWISSEEMYRHFHASDLVVFPGTHSVIWEQAMGMGMPGVYKRWKGIEHIDKGGNIEFISGDSEEELKKIIYKIVMDADYYMSMRKVADYVKKDFYYTNIAKKSLMIEGENREDEKNT